MANTPLSCPLCDLPCADEFLMADHLMMYHLADDVIGRTTLCFCGRRMSNNIVVVMTHLYHYGGAQEHYLATLLGIDP